MHTACVAGVLDLDAAVHDHCKAAILRDAGAFLVDHRELTPQALGADRDGVPCDPGQRRRCAEDVDDIDGDGTSRRVAKLRSPRISDSRGFTGMTR